MPDDIRKIIEDTAKATAKEVRHEFDIVMEDLENGTLKAINEQLDSQAKQLAQLEGVPAKLNKIEARLGSIEATLQGTETEKPLKQRVGDLEERVEDLEAVSPTATPMEED